MMVSNQSLVVAVKDQVVSVDLAGEAVILNLTSGIYYGLDEVGSRIWEIMQEPSSVQTIRDKLLEEYDVEREKCEQDLLELISQLKQYGLVEVNGQ